MVPRQPTLTPAQAEELLQILLGLIDDSLRTGNTTKVFESLTLLNAARLMLVPQYAQEPRAYAALGMLHWLRYQRMNDGSAHYEAAYRFFTHVHPLDLRVLPDGLREQFAANQPPREPVWEVWHSHARTLMLEFVTDRGERLLDHAIMLYRQSLDAAPAACAQRSAMEFNLGVALFERFRILQERDDLDASVVAFQRAAQTLADGDPNREFIWPALGDALSRRFHSTRALADADAAIGAYRVALPLKKPFDEVARMRWFDLGIALWRRFQFQRSTDTLAEALDVFQTLVEQTAQGHPARPDILALLTVALIARYDIYGNLDDLHAALRAAESAVAEAPAEHPHRAEFDRNVEVVRAALAAQRPSRGGSDFASKLRPYVARPESVPPEAVEGAPEILPGIVVAICVEDDSGVTLLSGSQAMEIARAAYPEAAERGLELLRQVGIANLRSLPFPRVQMAKIGENRPDAEVFLLETEDCFLASRITFVDDLAEWAASGRPRTHGVLLAIPTQRTLLLHFPSGPGVLDAFELMRISADGLFGQTPDSNVSRHVYYIAPDGHREIVVSPRDGGAFTRLLYGSGGLLQ